MAETISVIIPAYNGIRFLRDAVDSVQAQQHDSVEILVVDDGSTDGTFELAQSLPGLRCFRQNNSGPAAARNLGIQNAHGDYLAFLDADDLWAADKLALQLKAFLEDPILNLVAGLVEEFYADPSARMASRELRRSGDRAYTIGALLVRRDDFLKIGYLNPALKFGEFMDWRSRAVAYGLNERVLDTVVLKRRIHDQNTTLRSTNSKYDYMATIRAHLMRTRALTTGPDPNRFGGK